MDLVFMKKIKMRRCMNHQLIQTKVSRLVSLCHKYSASQVSFYEWSPKHGDVDIADYNKGLE
jgi:hypothetical protein